MKVQRLTQIFIYNALVNKLKQDLFSIFKPTSEYEKKKKKTQNYSIVKALKKREKAFKHPAMSTQLNYAFSGTDFSPDALQVPSKWEKVHKILCGEKEKGITVNKKNNAGSDFLGI